MKASGLGWYIFKSIALIDIARLQKKGTKRGHFTGWVCHLLTLFLESSVL